MKIKVLLVMQDKEVQTVKIPRSSKFIKALIGNDLLKIRLDKDISTGAVVTSVEKGSPAYSGGLKKGDVIVKVGSEKVENVAEFRFYLYKYNPNDKASITINRDGKEKKVNVKLEKAE